MAIILGALFFGIAGCVGILLAGTVKAEPFEDGPAPAEPPLALIVAGCAIVGAFVGWHGGDGTRIVLYALVVCALAAIWCTDVRYGLVPDAFTLTPLAIVLFAALLRSQPWPLFYAMLPLAPFAVTAAISRGRGIGWGDVKLAALGGAVLGAEVALLAFAASCLAAVVFAYARGRRTQPIAFAPYLACAIGACIPLEAVR